MIGKIIPFAIVIVAALAAPYACYRLIATCYRGWRTGVLTGPWGSFDRRKQRREFQTKLIVICVMVVISGVATVYVWWAIPYFWNEMIRALT